MMRKVYTTLLGLLVAAGPALAVDIQPLKPYQAVTGDIPYQASSPATTVSPQSSGMMVATGQPILPAGRSAGAESVGAGNQPSRAPGGQVSLRDLKPGGSQQSFSQAKNMPMVGSYFEPNFGPYEYWAPSRPPRGFVDAPAQFSQLENGNVTCTNYWLGIDVFTQTASTRMWHGYDNYTLYEDHGGPSDRVFWGHTDPTWYYSPTLDIAFGDSGFHSSIQAFLGPRKYNDLDSQIYMGYWDHLYAESLQLRFGYAYYDFRDPMPGWSDYHEIFGSVTAVALPLRPSYTFMHDWFHGKFQGGDSGNFHVFGISEAVPVPCMLTPGFYQELTLMSDVWYNDGWNGADSDWSHATFGIETDINLGCGATFTPGLYYQVTMDRSVNEENEFWARFAFNLPITSVH